MVNLNFVSNTLSLLSVRGKIGRMGSIQILSEARNENEILIEFTYFRAQIFIKTVF